MAPKNCIVFDDNWPPSANPKEPVLFCLFFSGGGGGLLPGHNRDGALITIYYIGAFLLDSEVEDTCCLTF